MRSEPKTCEVVDVAAIGDSLSTSRATWWCLLLLVGMTDLVLGHLTAPGEGGDVDTTTSWSPFRQLSLLNALQGSPWAAWDSEVHVAINEHRKEIISGAMTVVIAITALAFGETTHAITAMSVWASCSGTTLPGRLASAGSTRTPRKTTDRHH